MKRSLLLAGLTSLGTLASHAFSQSIDPVDKNKSGPYAGAALSFGQSTKVGSGSGGAAWFLGLEPGYGMARDTWNRIELSVELGTGHLSYKDKSDGTSVSAESNVPFYGLIKAGYGYSMGDHVFAVWRLGVGPAMVDYKGKLAGVSAKSSTESGIVYQLGVDVVAPMDDRLDIYGGASFRAVTFHVDEVKSQGTTHNFDRDFQINIPMVQLGARLHF